MCVCVCVCVLGGGGGLIIGDMPLYGSLTVEGSIWIERVGWEVGRGEGR